MLALLRNVSVRMLTQITEWAGSGLSRQIERTAAVLTTQAFVQCPLAEGAGCPGQWVVWT